MKQTSFLKNELSAYGGELMKTRRGRARPRPLDTRSTMHLVLRSSKAKGDWSFRRPRHEKRIREIVEKFSHRHGVRVLSMANVGNHLHFQVKLSNRHLYKPFIRGMTAAIAMAVTGASRWRPMRMSASSVRQDGAEDGSRAKFWDYRPFTRVVQSYRAFLNLRDYLKINQLEGEGVPRATARWIVERSRGRRVRRP